MNDILLTVDDLAKYFGKSKKTIYNWVEGGVFPAELVYRPGGQLRFKRKEIEMYVDSTRRR